MMTSADYHKRMDDLSVSLESSLVCYYVMVVSMTALFVLLKAWGVL